MEEAFGGDISVEEIKDPGITGNFEVVAFGDLIWSKANGQGFPSSSDQVETIIAHIKARQHGNKNHEFK